MDGWLPVAIHCRLGLFRVGNIHPLYGFKQECLNTQPVFIQDDIEQVCPYTLRNRDEAASSNIVVTMRCVFAR